MRNKANLPWEPDCLPLMLAPMQGITNRALRGLFIELVRPDVVFTEFVRVRPASKKAISETDRLEVTSRAGVPLVVQLIGSDTEALIAAAENVQELGAKHLNINIGCPYGRMTSKAAGGGLLRDPERLAPILKRLRRCIYGGFSVKLRSGFDDPSQALCLTGLFEDCGVDFLIVHPRTVRQRFDGKADHRITAEIAGRTSLPVIANGDILSAANGRQVLAQTGAAGLMLGRGAIADPFIFERLRGRYPDVSGQEARLAELRDYLQELLNRYRKIFCGEHQVLCKMKEVVRHINDPCFSKSVRRLKRSGNLAHFTGTLAAFSSN